MTKSKFRPCECCGVTLVCDLVDGRWTCAVCRDEWKPPTRELVGRSIELESVVGSIGGSR